MIKTKDVFHFSQKLCVLYVEDDPSLRDEMTLLLSPFFEYIEIAVDGIDGLQKYNHQKFDIVITDINMPRMNGIQMIVSMREIHPEQKIIAISAHNESEILINLIENGVNSFILKPIIQQNILNVLYPVCRDANTQNLNVELFEMLNNEKSKLKKQVRLLCAQLNAVSIKNDQVNELLNNQENNVGDLELEKYFSKDEDDGVESVILIKDDSDEMTDILDDMLDQIFLYSNDFQREHIKRISILIGKLSNILYRYTPFLDPLAKSIGELAHVIVVEELNFIELFEKKPEHILKLFDAICIDMTLYIKRFSVESMAMKNIHHIHLPTLMSIQQVIGIINPTEIEEGDLELF
ncbi:response regulator [Sulfuricurvum sp.]|uniref:response regulator transcription factor n=1 Tax=Sulfuricurvum sp. TaxID=2025608 RepID=UPI0025E60E13|nr:response regulator [Sulfuricurvum sp.]